MRNRRGEIGLLLLLGIAILSIGSVFYTSYEAKQFINETEDVRLGTITNLGDTINTFRQNVNATDEALRSTTSSDPGHTHTSGTIATDLGTSSITGVWGNTQGGTDNSSSGPSGAILVSNGSIWNTTDTLPVTSGGTGTSTLPADNEIWISNGTELTTSTLPDCDTDGTDLFLYTSSTHTFTCGTTPFAVLTTLPTSTTTSTVETGFIEWKGPVGVSSTFTLTGAGRVMVNFVGYANQDTADDTMVLTLEIDGVNIDNSGAFIANTSPVANGNMNMSFTYISHSLGSGAHTIKLLIRNDQASNSDWVAERFDVIRL